MTKQQEAKHKLVEEAKRQERERIQADITLMVSSGDLNFNNGVLLYDIIQNTITGAWKDWMDVLRWKIRKANETG